MCISKMNLIYKDSIFVTKMKMCLFQDQLALVIQQQKSRSLDHFFEAFAHCRYCNLLRFLWGLGPWVGDFTSARVVVI